MIDKNEFYKMLQTIYEDRDCPCTYDRQRDCLLIQIDNGPVLLSVNYDGEICARLELHMGLYLRTSAVPWHLLNRLNLKHIVCRVVILGCDRQNSPFGEVVFVYDVFDNDDGNFMDALLEGCDIIVDAYQFYYDDISHIRDVARIVEGQDYEKA